MGLGEGKGAERRTHLLAHQCVGGLQCVRSWELVGAEAGEPARGTNSRRALFASPKAAFYSGEAGCWEGFLSVEMCPEGNCHNPGEDKDLS